MARRAALLLLASVLALPGCGLGSGEERAGGGAELRVTRDFGHDLLASAALDPVREGDTVMRFLQSERDVETRYGGGFVQSIDGLAGEGSGGDRDWFYFVNGLEAGIGAADYELSGGDVVQWDYRRWDAAMSVPAIVGAYPEPFLSGSEGKRLPTRVECEDDASTACREVKERLSAEGVAPTGAPLGAPAGPEVLRVVVARWPVARELRAVAALEDGPADSGVFARFAPGGDTVELLDEAGDEARSEGEGTGLVAATALPEQQAVWLVTGTDDAGVESAARTLDPELLRDAFAVAATPDGPVRLPVVSGEPGEREAGSQ
jgi:hypothetical protein